MRTFLDRTRAAESGEASIAVGLAVAARRLAKLIWITRHPMSALGHKRTSRAVQLMAALPPKADIGGRIFDVRFVPEADATRFHIDVPESEHSALIESITF